MKTLITAGNTQTTIDQVRCITNIFTGYTGAQIALEAQRRGHSVTLLTSHPEAIQKLAPGFAPQDGSWEIQTYRTFEDLQSKLKTALCGGQYDTFIHCAAVSDYYVAGLYVPAAGTQFDLESHQWSSAKNSTETANPSMVDVRAGKVKSHHSELWMRLTQTPKLADAVRNPWGFRGIFVKFKLEVGVSDQELLQIAQRSRIQSDADLIVANTLEGKNALAWICAQNQEAERIERADLPRRLWERIESLVSVPEHSRNG